MIIKLGNLQALRNKGISIHAINQREIVVLADGKNFHAFDRLCPHAKGDLAKARFADGCLVCENHGLKFNLLDGSLDYSELDEDIRESLNTETPAKYRLRVYATQIQGDCLWLDFD